MFQWNSLKSGSATLSRKVRSRWFVQVLSLRVVCMVQFKNIKHNYFVLATNIHLFCKDSFTFNVVITVDAVAWVQERNKLWILSISHSAITYTKVLFNLIWINAPDFVSTLKLILILFLRILSGLIVGQPYFTHPTASTN